ncbi:MAG: ATP-binding protein [Atopobiaceae bacterium]|nr:ATP-binding protein [Atopobiaceae bacterium]
MTELYTRERYLEKIRPFYHDDDIVKVIVGVRRCGKSSIMQMIADELQAQGIPQENLLFLNLDKRGFRHIKKADDLDVAIERLTNGIDGLKYLFIDEVQNVTDFEEVINAWREEGDVSIFITGSNSYLLSGELATKLTGRYIEFEVFTLTFDEYEEMKSFYGKPVSNDLQAELDTYLLEGGFPRAVRYDTLAEKRTYVESVIQEIFDKDVRRRAKIRNRSVFDRVQAYLFNNYGTPLSVKNIAEYFRNVEKTPIKEETLYRYIRVLEEAKILYRCPRFDMKSKKSLAREEKLYLTDTSFYFARNTDNRINYGPALENIVYLYARSRGWSASVGRIGTLECDFIMRNQETDYAYIQVSYTIAERSTEDREYRSLERIADGFPKWLLTCDRLLQKRSGIMHENLAQFLALTSSFWLEQR